MEKAIKFAFHVHTKYSSDSDSEPGDIVESCRENQIDVIAICDHNEIDGAFECHKIAQGNPMVIIGEEIKTTEGEIIGLFLDHKIERGLSPEATIKQIRDQGGLVCLPHPGETLRRSAVNRKKVLDIIDKIDALEIYNSRTFLQKDNDWAEMTAKKYNKLALYGSDGHFVHDIARTINLIANFKNKDDFLSALPANQPLIKKITFFANAANQVKSKLIKRRKKSAN